VSTGGIAGKRGVGGEVCGPALKTGKCDRCNGDDTAALGHLFSTAMSSAASSASALSKELDEDIYMDALAAIIERDFFPNLAKYRAQGEYLDVRFDAFF